MKAGKVVIQDAYGFYAWACGESCTMINVRFLFVSKEECSDMSSRLENVRAVKVKGTMKIHAVAGRGMALLLFEMYVAIGRIASKGHCAPPGLKHMK